MKIKSEFILKKIAGENVVVFLSPEFSNKVVTLNDTGAFLFWLLKEDRTEDALSDALTAEYDIDLSTAKSDVKKFIDALNSFGALE